MDARAVPGSFTSPGILLSSSERLLIPKQKRCAFVLQNTSIPVPGCWGIVHCHGMEWSGLEEGKGLKSVWLSLDDEEKLSCCGAD